MPWPAAYRSWQLTPPRTLEELRPSAGAAGDVVLRCVMPGCTACARFETEGRATFEEDRFRNAGVVLEWNCRSAPHRALAQQAGVNELPAYVVIAPSPATGWRVVRPE